MIAALSTAKISQASLSSLDSTKIALQAQQYAAAEASVLQATNYDDLSAHDRQIIQNTDYYSEVELSEESDYNDDVKQRTATVSIYRGNEVLPRYTLKTLLLSAIKDTGVPVGTVIAWPANSLPQESGTWLECNGQSCAAYPKLVAVLGKSTVPDFTDRFLEGSNIAGTIKEPGLPNITGYTISTGTSCIRSAYGTFYRMAGVTYQTSSSSSTSPIGQLGFDASRSNAIYGASETVQPAAVTVKYLIKAA